MNPRVLLIGLSLLISGCSLFTRPAREAEVRRADASQAAAERSGMTAARAGELERQGLSAEEARAVAETESRLKGR